MCTARRNRVFAGRNRPVEDPGGNIYFDTRMTVDEVNQEDASLWVQSPLIKSKYISEAADCDVWLKCEFLQPSGSFKSR